MRSTALKIYFDGGCRPNPGQMETAVVVRGVTYLNTTCGVGTSNDAEWLALIHAAEIASFLKERNILLLGDSALVAGQANGTAKCRSAAFQAYLIQFQLLVADFDRVTVRKIPRTQNLAGVALARTHL